MSHFFGWLLAVIVTFFFLQISAESIFIYIDIVTIVFLFGTVYGLSLVIFGGSKTLQSIIHIKSLFTSGDTANKVLSNIYLTQIKLAIIASLIGFSAGLMMVFANYELADSNSIGPQFAILMPLFLYSSIIIGLIYYPLYKKLA